MTTVGGAGRFGAALGGHPTISVVQHEVEVGTGRLGAILAAAGVAIREGAPDGLVVLGGSMSANDEGVLRRGYELIEDALRRGVPVLGLCLGAQMVARTLGARVRRNPEREIGWRPVWWLGGDPLFEGLAQPEWMFHWHEETFDIPAGATRLARSEACENQAFRHGANVYGIQFHLEATPETIAAWVKEDGGAAAVDPWAHRQEMDRAAHTVFGRWATLVGCSRP